MRADRLLSILLLLQANRHMTAGNLARRLEVSERTIHRDMEALGAAGVPVYAQRGTGGGWLLSEAYRTSLPGLNEAEVQALFLAAPQQLLADLGLRHAADAALLKLLAALPAAHRRDAEYARQRILVDTAGWNRSEEAVPALPALQEAVWRGLRVRIAYRRGDGEEAERTLHPLGLVAKGSLWYLVAASGGEPRTYRVSRVRSVALLEEPCLRPSDFDLAAFWAESSAGFTAALPRYPVTVRVPAEILPRLGSAGGYVRVDHIGAPDPDGWVEVRLLCETEENARGFVLHFGGQMRIVEPAVLREQVARLAAEVVALYAEPVEAAGA
jgi:predicted DNA-binding transcriptional regulator YafY